METSSILGHLDGPTRLVHSSEVIVVDDLADVNTSTILSGSNHIIDEVLSITLVQLLDGSLDIFFGYSTIVISILCRLQASIVDSLSLSRSSSSSLITLVTCLDILDGCSQWLVSLHSSLGSLDFQSQSLDVVHIESCIHCINSFLQRALCTLIHLAFQQSVCLLYQRSYTLLKNCLASTSIGNLEIVKDSPVTTMTSRSSLFLNTNTESTISNKCINLGQVSFVTLSACCSKTLHRVRDILAIESIVCIARSYLLLSHTIRIW